MTPRSLSFGLTPPLSVPMQFILPAPWLGSIAAVFLLWSLPESLQSRWRPELLAATHLFTVGFLLPVMVGALLQVVPVVFGRSLPGRRRWSAVMVALLAGTIGLALGFTTLETLWFLLAVTLLLIALAVAGWGLLPRVFMAAPGNASALPMRLAFLSLLFGLSVGIYLALGYSWPGRFGGARLWTDSHVLWIAFAWPLLLIMAVSIQVIPMFQVAPAYPRRWPSALACLIVAGLAVGTLAPAIGLPRLLAELGVSVSLGAAIAYALLSLSLLRRALAPGRTLPCTTGTSLTFNSSLPVRWRCSPCGAERCWM
ncbi:hypothetical protein [Alkalilimnicola ehrlichii]|uniref:Cytochrome oxidase subunit I profile domain-containing protein n=1 Tax=Alkalilimnicola ehrlichii TaxID=351052 RepID=A0A3E0WWJ0_9GAMM|nr:hypothetical protein [Alkalilimnicola ehrlichii]RFA36543.1 hypothetical protein CAL65_11315 [Alkalilimnicola ehrlichii]